jgi:hypothetical protein
MDQRAEVVVEKSRLRPILFVLWALVVAAGVSVEVLRLRFGLSSRSGILPLLSMSYEGNVPTFYTSAILGLVSILCSISAASTKKHAAHFWILAAGFLYIAIDEVFQFHEFAGTFVKGSGVLFFTWVIPAAVVVLVVGLSFIPFLRSLPSKTRFWFLLSGAIYVGGAVGMELPLGWWTELHGTQNLGYALIDAVEEAMEMIGVNLFLLALIDRLADENVSLRFSRGISKVDNKNPEQGDT